MFAEKDLFAVNILLGLEFSSICDIRPEWIKMQIQHIRIFSSEPSELAILKE